jgi:hypothetical protein
VFKTKTAILRTVKHGVKALIFCGISAFLANSSANSMVSEATGNPYQGIVSRNPFGLKPIPQTPVAPPTAPQSPATITLGGITDILGRKQALLKVHVAARPPAPAKDDSYILAEGQTSEDIEVVAIDLKGGVVKVNNHGTPQTLDFASNGAKLPAAALLAPPMGTPPPGAPTLPLLNTSMRQPTATQPADGGPGLAQTGGAAVPGSNPGFVPSSNVGSGAANSSLNFNGSTQPGNRLEDMEQFHTGLTQEQQAALIEAQRGVLRERGDPDADKLPPTDLQ